MLTVDEYAKATDLSPRRVRALISAGKIAAERYGHMWLIKDSIPQVRKAQRHGPKLSLESFDRLAGFLDGEKNNLTPKQRFTCKKLAHEILEGGLPTALAIAERKTLTIEHFWLAPDDLLELAQETRIVPTGVSHPSSMIAGDVVDGYVLSAHRKELMMNYLFRTALPDTANVRIRFVSTMPEKLYRLHILTDLLADNSYRSITRANEILTDIRQDLHDPH